MEEKEIVVNGKTYTIKEVKYKDLISLADISKEEGAKKLMLLSTSITEEEYNELGMRTGIELQKNINEINGLSDSMGFQEPLKE